jgi:ribosomal protein S18 acetylase RimI-like enzyme
MPNMTYYKRFRMEMGLTVNGLARSRLVPRFRFVAWDPSLLEVHAEVKYLSFRGEIDSLVFPCLGDLNGCKRLMQEISSKPGFLPEATWLVAGPFDRAVEPVYCGTIQGIVDRAGFGAIQNLGVLPEYRGLGLGRALMEQALEGFRRVGMRRGCLEVTAQNAPAIQLYRRIGFAKTKTIYKVVEVAYSPAAR